MRGRDGLSRVSSKNAPDIALVDAARWFAVAWLGLGTSDAGLRAKCGAVDDLRVASERVIADDFGMAYIIERNERFYVVAYDGSDPRTGKERRRWHPAGRSRADAEAIAARLSAERQGARERPMSALTVEQFLLDVWLPRRRRELRPSTARRYQWYIDNYITPAIGYHRLAGLRAEHLDRMYVDLLAHGGRNGDALSAKTVYDVHVVMRSSLRFAVDRHLVDHNVAADARPPRTSTRSRPSAEIWTAQQLASFLAHTAHLRLYPAIHLAATTGMRRGEIAGLRWGDWHVETHRLSVPRSRQSIQGGTVEVPTKTAQADGPLISTPTPNRSSPDGVAGSNATGNPLESTTPSSRTDTASRSIPNRSANSSTARP